MEKADTFFTFFSRRVSLSQKDKVRVSANGRRIQVRIMTDDYFQMNWAWGNSSQDTQRQQSKDISEPLAIVFENLWRTDELLKEWKKADIMFISKWGEQKKPENYMVFCLTFIQWKVLEQIIE